MVIAQMNLVLILFRQNQNVCLPVAEYSSERYITSCSVISISDKLTLQILNKAVNLLFALGLIAKITFRKITSYTIFSVKVF